MNDVSKTISKALPKKDTIYSTLSTPEIKYSIKKI